MEILWLLTLSFVLLKVTESSNLVLRGSNQVKNATLNKTYVGVVANGVEDIYFFKLTPDVYPNATVRISVSSRNATDEAPVLFVARLTAGVLSWSVPFTSDEGKKYNHVSQTLCPALNRGSANMSAQENFFLDISTANLIGLEYIFRAYIEPEFVLEPNVDEVTHVNPAESMFFVYTFQGDQERVLVKAVSNSSICAKILIQTSKCPIVGTSRSDYNGVYASMTTKAGITVERRRIPQDKFYIVVVVKDTDVECLFQSGTINPFLPPNKEKHEVEGLYDLHNDRSKTVVLTVIELPQIDDYIMPVLGPVIFFGSFYVIAFISLVISWCFAEDGGKSFYAYLFPSKVKKDATVDDDTTDGDGEKEQLLRSPIHSRHSSYGTAEATSYQAPEVPASPVADDMDGYDWLEDIDKNKDVYRLKLNLTVADLSRKPYKKLNKKFNVYYWNILTVAVFYALPVVQLVLTYQRVVNASGDQDICYYNNFCQRPYHLLSAFNNVYSNIGYMMLGLLFIFLVMRRDRLARQRLVKNPENEEKYGIPRHYGILYAMGYALFMEGVMSACYHVCPNYSNFQFDTAFMYIIGILGCLRLYQTRHHDVFLSAHFAYAGFAAVIFTSVIGVIFRSREFWVIFLIGHFVSCFYLSCQIYYMGRVKTAFRVNWLSSRHNICTRPVYPMRFVLLIVFNIVNWTLSINGIVYIPKDFATYLLGIIICNGLLYVTFYGIMKLWNGEKIKALPFICMVASLITWGISISFFIQGLTDWQLSPAQSRQGNKDCRLLGFYDDHDLWHFLSATAMFFSFMGVLTVDDDLDTVERTNINVF